MGRWYEIPTQNKRFGVIMKIGDLVRARHWEEWNIGVIVSIRRTGICRVFLVSDFDYRFDVLMRDFEVVCE